MLDAKHKRIFGAARVKDWRQRFPQLLLMGVVTLSSTGCVPGAVWLPDSSGFIYTTRKGELRHFDITAGKERVIAKTGTETIWPAVSPDGKRIAVADIKKVHAGGVGFDTKYKTTLQVIVYDRRGVVQYKSKTMKWGSAQLAGWYGDNRRDALLFWVPQKETVLIGGDNAVGIFDLKTEKMQRIPKSALVVVGDTPIRPDGKGYLMVGSDAKKDGALLFMTWQHQATRITGALGMLPREPKDEKTKRLVFMLAAPSLRDSRWINQTAAIRWSDTEIRIDTEKGTSSVDKIEVKKTAYRKVIQYQHDFPSGDIILRIVEIEAPKETDGIPIEPGKYRIESLEVERKKLELLAGNTHMIRAFPSPDKKFVALRFFEPKGNQPGLSVERILVVGGNGKKVATLQLSD